MHIETAESVESTVMRLQRMLRKVDRICLPPASRRDLESILVRQVTRELDRLVPWQAGHGEGISAEPMHERIKSLYQLTGEAIETARRVSVNLRPNVLDNLGLCGAIEWLIREFEQRTNIQCSLESITSDLSRINKHHETSIFRIIQEAFINIAKHARASKVNVELLEDEDMLIISIKDNGIGITQPLDCRARDLLE